MFFFSYSRAIKDFTGNPHVKCLNVALDIDFSIQKSPAFDLQSLNTTLGLNRTTAPEGCSLVSQN